MVPDDGSTNYYPVTVSGLNPSSIDSVFGLETVCININHTWDADLNVSLRAPDGTTVDLTKGNGGSDDNYTHTCFNAGAASSIVTGIAPFTGTFVPQGFLGNIKTGRTVTGHGSW